MQVGLNIYSASNTFKRVTIRAISDENTTIRADLTLFLRLAEGTPNSRPIARGCGTAVFTSTNTEKDFKSHQYLTL
jgi:hypothetical protein